MEDAARRGSGIASEADAAAAETRPTLLHRAEYAALRTFAGVAAVVPAPIAWFLARRVGDLVHLAAGSRRRVARQNLRERLLDEQGRPPAEKDVRRIARDSFRHLAVSAVEIVRLGRETKRRPLSDFVTVLGREHVDAALARGKGIVLVSGHVGNWEVGGAVCKDIGQPFTTVYRPLDNPLLDRWVRGTRSAAGQTMIAKEGAMRPLLRGLREGRMVALIVDQDARRHGVFAPFFGVPSSTPPTPAELALRTGATILPLISVRVGPGRHECRFEAPVPVEDTDDHDADVLRITAAINARIEAAVRRAPEQWLWSHRRWKSKPSEAPPAATS